MEPTSPEDCLAHPLAMGRGAGPTWAVLRLCQMGWGLPGPCCQGLLRGAWVDGDPCPAGEELGSQLRPHCSQPTGFHRQPSLCSPPSASPTCWTWSLHTPLSPGKCCTGRCRPPPGLSSLPGDSSGHALVPLGRRAAKATNPRGQTSMRGHGHGARAPEGRPGVQWTQLRHGFNE